MKCLGVRLPLNLCTYFTIACVDDTYKSNFSSCIAHSYIAAHIAVKWFQKTCSSTCYTFVLGGSEDVSGHLSKILSIR